MKTTFLALLLVALAVAVTACGQRVAPNPPEGKVYSSTRY